MKTIIIFTSLLLSLIAATPTAMPLEVVSERHWNPSCPPNGTLPANHISPSLIVPVSSNLPDVAFGPTSFPLITPNDFCSIFNLVVPPSGVGKTCTLEFLFPSHSQTFAPFVYSGGGHFTFTGYAFGSGATPQTTYNQQPPAGPSPPQPPAVLQPGNAYTINVGGCAIEEGMK
ncbi:hypothetical protein EG329_013466 [Mollisiaceae sp. DMI_Dod_QoI]|nr:hypothetical protein EG329_013466 [Helotiales sp. DMI_Dod_QoI]